MTMDLEKVSPLPSSGGANTTESPGPTHIDTTLCPYCREIIKIGALRCKHCKESLTPPGYAHQGMAPHPPGVAQSDAKHGNLWLPIISLILGILCFLALLDDSEWDSDTIIGLFMFSAGGIATGVISVATQHVGKGMAIAGIVTSSIGLLAFVGMIL